MVFFGFCRRVNHAADSPVLHGGRFGGMRGGWCGPCAYRQEAADAADNGSNFMEFHCFPFLNTEPSKTVSGRALTKKAATTFHAAIMAWQAAAQTAQDRAQAAMIAMSGYLPHSAPHARHDCRHA